MPDPPTIRGATFQHASPQAFPAFHPHGTPAWRHPIPRPRPTVKHQGIERPVRIGAHLDPALATDQYSHLLTAFSAFERSQGGIHQTLGLFGEPLHPLLIAILDRGFTLFEK